MAKSNFFKNPQRAQTKKFQPYTPQYVLRGLEPEVIASATVPETFERVQTTRHAPVVSYDNPRTRPTPTVVRNIPFAEIPSGPSPIGDGPLPNIGNNVENTWASVDGDVFDDISEEAVSVRKLDPNQKMIDNNFNDPRVYKNTPSKLRPNSVYNKVVTPVSVKHVTDFDYVLMVDGEVLSTGFLEEIQEEVRSLIYGEHYLCESANITPDDIIVLKKVKIKVGVFIE